MDLSNQYPDRVTVEFLLEIFATCNARGGNSLTGITFEVTESHEGGYDAHAIGYSIFTRGEDWNELIEMAREAVLCHFDEAETPEEIRLLQVSNDIITVYRSQ